MMKSKFMCGMCTGLIAGAAIGMMVSEKKSKKKGGKGAAGRVIKKIGAALEDAAAVMGL